MRICLLGPCQIFWQDEPFPLTRRQVRALLFRLAATGAPLAREQLAFLFWPDEPTAAARRRLTRLLSSLRAALPRPDLLLVTDETAALHPDLVAVDSGRFQAACAGSDVALLQTAVQLYRGPFMSGFVLADAPEYEAWQAETARLLEQHYLGALARLVDLLQARGDLAAAAQFARQYLATDELDERIHRRLIALYAATGQRTAAQRQYEQCALILERELGVSPLPETRAALMQVAALPPRTPPRAPAEPPLLGRDALLSALATTGRQLSDGGLILIKGDPGQGKTRLLQAFSAAWPGLQLRGDGHPGSRRLPYQPLSAALRRLTAAQWAALPAVWRSELLPLLPELRARFPDLPDPPPAAPEQAQGRLWEALVQAFAALPRPMLLCLDDLQWADEATLGWLRFLAGRRQETGLLLAATARPASNAGLEAVLHAWERAGSCVILDLKGLDATAVAGLLHAAGASPALAERVHTVTAGNPFFVLAIAAQLRAHGDRADPALALPLPPTVREAILGQLVDLSPLARQLLEAAAVLETALDDALLQQTAARTPDELADGLDELLSVRLSIARRAGR